MSIYNTVSSKVYSKPAYIGAVEVLEYIMFIIILYKYNPFSISTAYTNLITLAVALIYVLLFYFLQENLKLNILDGQGEGGFIIKALATMAFFLGTVFVLKFIGYHLTQGNLLSVLFRYGVLAVILIIAGAIIYLIGKPIFDKAQNAEKGKVSAFFLNLLFYFPCLLVSIVNYFKNEYRITTKPVWLLLLAEVVLIIFWYIIPIILHAYTTKNGLQLLKAPENLNVEKTVGTYEQLYVDEARTNANDSARFNYHYSLSAWFYLNPQPPNTSIAYNKYTNILSYGNKPAIEFNGHLNSLRVLVESEKTPGKRSKVKIFETKQVLYQKWNNIVINYDHGTMDVFLNGALVGSKPGIAPYMTFESIKLGSNNGLQGGISNVMYFKENLSRNYIELLYNTLRRGEEPFL
jgi:hypothetical protein